MVPLNRRTVLTCLGAAAGSLAGCVGLNSPDPQEPDDCPTSLDLSVSWPDEITEDSVVSFVEAYEEVYLEQQRETELHSIGATSTVEEVESHEAGYVLEVESEGSVIEPYLVVSASPADQPEATQIHDVDDLDGSDIRAFVEDAVEGEQYTETSDTETINRYVEALDELVDNHSRYVGAGESVTLYFGIENSIVALTLNAIKHTWTDEDWAASYYVDENVLRRTHNASPATNGRLLECRIDS